MLESARRYLLRHPVRAVASILAEPLETWTALQERLAARIEPRVPPDLYHANGNWERDLHRQLRIPWPCSVVSEFWELWPKVVEELEAKGISVGPQSFKNWNDGDAGFVRSIWCLTRHLRPRSVVETGVAHGVTTRFILEALERNGTGHLWSIDYPPLDHVWHEQVGMAVGDRFLTRWSYVRGSSRRRLGGVLSKLDGIDLFIHDSIHSEHNVRFEVDRAWAALRPGGAMVIDDIDANRGFQTFTRNVPDCCSIACEAEPLRPDFRRFNLKGLFGIVLKNQGASSA